MKNIKDFGDMLAAASTVVKIDGAEKGVLIYRTAPMTTPLEIGGPIELDLRFATTARDTDFLLRWWILMKRGRCVRSVLAERFARVICPAGKSRRC